MAETLHKGTWLLIDAAGPVSVIGLIEGNVWRECVRSEGDFLEGLEPTIQELLSISGLALPDLSGVLYGSGPGSTLGLRLAAIFIRTLLGIPSLNHWSCFQYHNLELAISALKKNPSEHPAEAVAPWRRDRLHYSKWDTTSESFKNEDITPQEAVAANLKGVSLGRRHPGKSVDVDWRDYPIDKIPSILYSNQRLLKRTLTPTPYSAEDPQFVQWNPKRHSSK